MFETPRVHIEHNGYTITSDKTMLQPTEIHQWLSTESYWAAGIPYEKVMRAIDNSFCIGALWEGGQIGFARLITDYAVFGYLADVYVEAPHRKRGLARLMCRTILDQEWVKQLRKVSLATRDAHEVYAGLGFTAPRFPERLMEITNPNPYNQ
jgi:GNAT superfamily N-acetyltransferase